MSIIPSGKRKEQINQGPSSNQHIDSILDSDLFKGAQTSSLIDDPVENRYPHPNADLQDAMNSGGLDYGGLSDKLDQDRNPPDVDSAQPGMGSPASRFLGRSDDDDKMQTDPNQMWREERQKIRNFIGGDFGMGLKADDNGVFTVTLTPPQGRPVQDPSGFMDALLQAIGGAAVNEEQTPSATDVGGNLTLKYRPSGSAPAKIRPRGKRR